MSNAQQIKVWNIPGGIHPPENKQQSMQQPLGDIPIPLELIFPLNQHLGVPAEPIVEVGDTVLAGQKIAEAVGVLSAPIHASTSGTIAAIEERVLPHASGMKGPCILLHSDGKHQSIEHQGCPDFSTEAPKDLIQRIREAGIAGLGGAGFPTAVKLNPGSETKIDTLILNGTECEPYITADDALMQSYADDVVQGARLLAYILGRPKRVVIGIEDNKPDALRIVQKAALDTGIEVASFPTKYPSGGEKQLIQIITGQEVPSGSIPAKLGIVVQNVGTAAAAWRAVAHGEPLTWRITTVVGEALQQQRNIRVLLGTPINYLLDHHGFDAKKCERLIMGGPMMGFSLPDARVPVVKTTNCILAPTTEELPPPPPAQACIRCGMCAEACPASLLPQQLYWYARAEEYERLQNHNLFDCIECGACAYVCPSNIPLVQYYRAAKGTIRHQEQEKTKSDHARQRFEFRKARQERAEQEKEAKRQARKKAAEEARRLAENKKAEVTQEKPETKEDPVAVAMARVAAKAQDPAAQKAKLERAVSSIESRVERFKQQWQEAEADQKEKLEAKLKQAEVRLQDAQQALVDFQSQTNAAANTETVEAKDEAPANDAASQAIEKAKAKAEAMAAMTPEQKLQEQISALEKRVQKSRDKLSKAEAENSEHVEVMRSALEKLEKKLKTTQAELETL